MVCTWKKVDGRYVCQATHCPHWSKEGCLIGKVSLTCDDNECKWNKVGDNFESRCGSMDVHLDADGKCLGRQTK